MEATIQPVTNLANPSTTFTLSVYCDPVDPQRSPHQKTPIDHDLSNNAADDDPIDLFFNSFEGDE